MRKQTKKAMILDMLARIGSIPLVDAARVLYNDSGELAQLKVIRLLNAYRVNDARFLKIRIIKKHIQEISPEISC
ncbi:hypothetical protein SDD30_01610 [Moorella naiadis]|uniref:hypothetical protein n=1 Tax=Moorella naiadis (nom. illeg.) TaxID=3093670 RepID=UPI003D9C8224